MIKKIVLGLLGLIILAIGGGAYYIFAYGPMIAESRACLGNDHRTGEAGCLRLLQRKQYAGRDFARVTAQLKQAEHALALGREEKAVFAQLDAAEELLRDPALAASAPDGAEQVKVFGNRGRLFRWAQHKLSQRPEEALRALIEGEKLFGFSAARQSMLACGNYTAGDYRASRRALVAGNGPAAVSAALAFMAGDDAEALEAARPDSGVIEALTAITAGRTDEARARLDNILASPVASPPEARAGLYAARGTARRLLNDNLAGQDFTPATGGMGPFELRNYNLQENRKLTEAMAAEVLARKARRGKKRARVAAAPVLDEPAFRSVVGRAALAPALREFESACEIMEKKTLESVAPRS